MWSITTERSMFGMMTNALVSLRRAGWIGDGRQWPLPSTPAQTGASQPLRHMGIIGLAGARRPPGMGQVFPRTTTK